MQMPGYRCRRCRHRLSVFIRIPSHSHPFRCVLVRVLVPHLFWAKIERGTQILAHPDSIASLSIHSVSSGIYLCVCVLCVSECVTTALNCQFESVPRDKLRHIKNCSIAASTSSRCVTHIISQYIGMRTSE